MQQINLYNLVKQLTGEIMPVSETQEDTVQLANLKKVILLVKKLVFDIEKASKYKDRIKFSTQEIGNLAYKFRNELTAWKN